MVAGKVTDAVKDTTQKSPKDSSPESSLKSFNITNSEECITHESQTDSTTQYNQLYLEQLLKDKNELRAYQSNSSLKHVNKLINREISNVLTFMSRHNLLDSNSLNADSVVQGEKVTLTETIKVPVEKYPRYNFVGRILGPRGMTAKQLEVETGCKIMVRGRGSSRVSNRRESGEAAPLHVVIQCEDFKSQAQLKICNAVVAISQLLHPPPEGKDELKRKQLIELSIINGTYRPTSATKVPLQVPRVFGQYGSVGEGNQETECLRTISSLIDSSVKQSRGLFNSDQKPFEQVIEPSQAWASMAQMASMLPPVQQQAALAPNLLSDYCKHLLAFPSPDPKNISSFLPTQPLEAFSNQASMLQPHIRQANLQQYLQAAAMLNSVPFLHNGSGDFNKSKRQ